MINNNNALRELNVLNSKKSKDNINIDEFNENRSKNKQIFQFENDFCIFYCIYYICFKDI